jgi:hypothetical protein
VSLADLQKQLAASLTGRGETPAGLEETAVERARRSLESKRRRVAAHLLPRLRQALGDAWLACFHEHAAAYNPTGMLHHVDDAWELAETLRRHPAPPVARAAHDDLLMLKLRYKRDRRSGAERIRERRGLVVGLLWTPIRRIVVRWPGRGGRVWSVRLTRGPHFLARKLSNRF